MRAARPVTRRGARAGFTLAELIVALLIGSVVLGATYKMLTSNQRFYRSQSQIMDVQQNLRTVSLILPGELHELDAVDGDILAMFDTSITIRAMRGFSVVCAPPNVGGGQIWLRNNLLFMSGAIDVTRDNVLVFREGRSNSNTDDSWLTGTIVSTNSSTCTDNSNATRLTVSLSGGNSQLDSVTIGAPVRIWEQVAYRLYNDGTGTWWLGTSTLVNNVWTATVPVAGPLAPTNGLQFAYYDSTGTVTATPAGVRQIGVTVRGLSTQAIQIAGKPAGPYKDSITVRVGLRNN